MMQGEDESIGEEAHGGRERGGGRVWEEEEEEKEEVVALCARMRASSTTCCAKLAGQARRLMFDHPPSVRPMVSLPRVGIRLIRSIARLLGSANICVVFARMLPQDDLWLQVRASC